MPEITLDQLKKELKKDKIDKEMFKNFYQQFIDEKKEFLETLYAALEKSAKEKEVADEIEKIFQKVICIEYLLDELKKEEIENKEKFNWKFKIFYNKIKQQKYDFQKYLEWAYEKSGRDKEIGNILAETAGRNASDLIESLKRLGYAVQKSLGEDFEKAGFRLLEQVRAGKRSDVMYGITRIFLANKQNLPDILNEAFKPYYSDEIFKCFMFTFISSAIKPKENNKEE